MVQCYLGHCSPRGEWRVHHWNVVFINRGLAILIMEVVRIAAWLRDKSSIYNRLDVLCARGVRLDAPCVCVNCVLSGWPLDVTV